RLRPALQEHHELVVLDVRRVRVAQDDVIHRKTSLLDRLEVLLPREEWLHLAALVPTSVLFGVDDDPHVHAAVDRGLEGLQDRLVVELVEAAAQAVASPGLLDELDDGLIEVASEPLERRLRLCRREVARRFVAEPVGIELAARDATVEEDVVLVAVELLRA